MWVYLWTYPCLIIIPIQPFHHEPVKVTYINDLPCHKPEEFCHWMVYPPCNHEGQSQPPLDGTDGWKQGYISSSDQQKFSGKVPHIIWLVKMACWQVQGIGGRWWVSGGGGGGGHNVYNLWDINQESWLPQHYHTFWAPYPLFLAGPVSQPSPRHYFLVCRIWVFLDSTARLKITTNAFPMFVKSPTALISPVRASNAPWIHSSCVEVIKPSST